MTPQLVSARVRRIGFSQFIPKPGMKSLDFLHISVPGGLGFMPKLPAGRNYASLRTIWWFSVGLTDEVGQQERKLGNWFERPPTPALRSTGHTQHTLRLQNPQIWLLGPVLNVKRAISDWIGHKNIFWKTFSRQKEANDRSSDGMPRQPSASLLGLAGRNVDSGKQRWQALIPGSWVLYEFWPALLMSQNHLNSL